MEVGESTTLLSNSAHRWLNRASCDSPIFFSFFLSHPRRISLAIHPLLILALSLTAGIGLPPIDTSRAIPVHLLCTRLCSKYIPDPSRNYPRCSGWKSTDASGEDSARHGRRFALHSRSAAAVCICGVNRWCVLVGCCWCLRATRQGSLALR